MFSLILGRLRALPVTAVAFGLLLLATVGSGWLLTTPPPGANNDNDGLRHTPDLTVEEFVATTLDETGAPRRRVRARSMSHFPDTDTHELQEPHLEVFSPGKEPWFVTSQRGWISAEGDVMLLLGDVHIWRNGADGSRRMDIRTSDLRVLPASEYGETDKPVTMVTPNSRSESVGARAFLKDGRVEMLSQVRTVYERNALKN